MTSRRNLTEGSVGGHIWRLSAAMGWGIVAMNAVQFTDMWFISRLGHDALAAISFTLPVTTLLFFMVLAMSSGMTSAIARASGMQRIEHAARTVTVGLIGSFIIGCLMMVGAYLLHEPVFIAMGATPELMPLIDNYMLTWLFGIPFMAICIVANSGTRGMGEGALPSYVMLLLAAVNFVLDPLLIFGLFGFPRMEMTGAALATVISYIVAMIAAVYIASHRMHLIRLKTLRNIHKTKKALKTWLHVVAPVSIAYAIEPFAAGVLTACVARMGLDAVAAFGVATRIEGVALIMLMALWGAVTPLAGQNWGARKYDRVILTIELSTIANGIFCAIFAVAMWMFGREVVSIFSQAPLTIELAVIYLAVVPISYVGFGASGLIGSALNGTGRGHLYLGANLFRVVSLVGMALVGTTLAGFIGFSLGIGAANLLAGALIVLWARRVFLAPMRV